MNKLLSVMSNNTYKIIGQSAKLQEVLRTASLVAGTDVPVLISGETGTGKDLFARQIHQQSQRKQRVFIKVDCTSDALETILFEPKKGAIYQARSGTLFLDKITYLAAPLQSKLLQVMEEETFDIRIIVATQGNLYNEVQAGNFQADLFYHLNVIPVELPTLKERRGDIEVLMEHFFRQLVKEYHQSAPSFSKAALKQIIQYEWLGNVRELHNFCERLFLLFSGKEVDVTNLPQEFSNYATQSSSPFNLPETGVKLDEVEVDLIHQALQTSSGNKSHAARLLGLTRDTFLYRLKKYSIDV